MRKTSQSSKFIALQFKFANCFCRNVRWLFLVQDCLRMKKPRPRSNSTMASTTHGSLRVPLSASGSGKTWLRPGSFNLKSNDVRRMSSNRVQVSFLVAPKQMKMAKNFWTKFEGFGLKRNWKAHFCEDWLVYLSVNMAWIACFFLWRSEASRA